MIELRVAARSAMVNLDGVPQHIRRGRTLAVAGHPIVVDNPGLWRPVPVDYDTDTPATAGDDVPDGRPSGKEVRAWARGQGIDVPARGRVPDDVYTAYEAAQDQ